MFGYFKFHGKQKDAVNAIKISVDGSAEPLTPNPLSRNFNYKIITKIKHQMKGTVKIDPWTNWKNMHYYLKCYSFSKKG